MKPRKRSHSTSATHLGPKKIRKGHKGAKLTTTTPAAIAAVASVIAAATATTAAAAAPPSTSAAAPAAPSSSAPSPAGKAANLKWCRLKTLVEQPLDAISFPVGWTDRDKEDALALGRVFKRDMLLAEKKLGRVRVEFIPRSTHHTAYEQHVQTLSQQSKSILDATLSPNSKRRDVKASETGFAVQQLAFHGTACENIPSIIQHGFYAPTKDGRHGPAIYTTIDPNFAKDYCKWDKKQQHRFQMLGCRAITFSGELFGHIYAVKEPSRVLPLIVFNFIP